MDDTELYTKLLGITPPWRVTQVTVNMAAERIDVWVEEAPGTKFHCAACGEPRAVYDHTRRAGVAAPRHLPVPDLRACPLAPDDLPGGWGAADRGAVGRAPRAVHPAV